MFGKRLCGQAQLLILILFLVIGCIIFWRFACRPYPTIKGHESKDLLKNSHGVIIIEKPPGGLVAISLPEIEEKVLRPSSGVQNGTVHTVSGPDIDGNVAYVENHYFDTKSRNRYYKLKISNLTEDKEITLFRRRGDPMWDNAISDWLALSPKGGKIAFTSNNHGVQMHNPRALVSVGDLEIWDINSEKGFRTGIEALNDSHFNGNRWFPQADAIAYVKVVSPEDSVNELKRFPGSIDKAKSLDKIPMIYIYSLSTKQETFIAPGQRPLVSDDGKHIMFIEPWATGNLSWCLYEMETGKIKKVKLPGAIRLYSLLEDGKVIYSGLPTRGTKPGYTKGNSPMVGPKPMKSLKIGVVDSSSFQTILPYIDLRHSISFGIIKED